MSQRNVILLTAFKMFAINGYDGVSLNNIIKETGLTKGGVYYHFGSKDELFIEVVQTFIINYYTEKVKEIVKNTKKNVKTRLQNSYCIPAFLINQASKLFPIESNSFAFYLMFDAIRKFPSMKQAIADCYTEVTGLIIALVIEGIENKEIKDDVDMQSLSIEIVSLLDGILMYSTLVPGINIEKQLKKIFQRTWQSIKV